MHEDELQPEHPPDDAIEQALDQADRDFIRVIEDVVELLIDKGVFMFTELPPQAQAKILKRQRLRDRHRNALDLLDDESLL
jgi:hypothetical protein